MRNILQIFKNDVKHMTGSIVCLIMVIGLGVIPCLYAWMNIMATMDPYSEEAMSRLKIAVVSDDEGTELYGVKLNMGDELVNTLKANNSVGWEFTETEKEAVDGVKSGEYYAAIVVPEDFSEDMLSFKDGEFVHPQLIYYENAKANVIASRITELAKDTVRDSLNSAFTSKLIGAVLTTTKVGSSMGIDYADSYDEILDRIQDLSDNMDSILKTTTAMKTLTDSSGKLIKSTQSVLPEVDGLVKDSSAELKSIWKRMENGQAEYADLRDSSVILLQQAIDTLDVADSCVNAEMEAAGEFTEDSAAAVKDLNKTLGKLNDLLYDSMDYILDAYPDSDGVEEAYNNAINMVNTAENLMNHLIMSKENAETIKKSSEQIRNDLKDIKTALNSAEKDLKALQKSIKELDSSSTAALNSAYSGLQDLSADLVTMEKNINEDITETKKSLNDLINDLNGDQRLDIMIDLAQKDIASITGILDKTGGVYNSSMEALSAYSKSLSSIAGDIDETRAVVSRLQTVTQNMLMNMMDFRADGSLDHLIKIADSDAETITDFIAEPVKLNTVAIYEIKTYGSANAPFYTLLALWVGAIFTLALFKARLSDKEKPENLRGIQEFSGRFLIILAIGEIQALLCSFGSCFYIGIDCVHPWLFILGCMVASLVFMLIVYSLSYAMGTIGLGASVVIILLQVAGSGGSFPIEVLPSIYQKLYPFMPFKQGLTMLREAVGGMYGNAYWISMLKLMLFGVIAIPLALIVRKIYAPLNDRMDKAKKDTGIML